LACDAQETVVCVPIWLWIALVLELRKRGQGRRESGAFLLGRSRAGKAKVTSYLCYDDIDPNAYSGGAITFHANGYAALWHYCREEKVEVLADVHTHPGTDVRQSIIDQRHPMVPVAGHTAIILPNFAKTSWWSLMSIGVYEYLGDFRWRAHPQISGRRRVRLTLW